jgi:hypothetical protein
LITYDNDSGSPSAVGYWTDGIEVSASESSSGNEVRRTEDGRLQLQLNNAYYIRKFEVWWGGRLAVYEPEYAERVRVSFNGLAWSVRHNQFDDDGTYPTNSLVNRKGYYSRWSGDNVPTFPVSLITFSATGMQGSRIDIERVYIEVCTSNPTPLTPTPTPTPIVYPIGVGLPAPTISNPSAYGACVDSSEASRPGCAVAAYLAVIPEIELENPGEPFTYEQFIALTINGEASILYLAPSPANPDQDLRCVYNGISDPTCANLRQLLEQAVVRQLYEVCGSDGCTEHELVQFMAGPPFDQFGIQAWYQAGIPGGGANTSGLIDGLIQGENYTFLEDNAIAQLSNLGLTSGCESFACSWGNPSQQPPPPNNYASTLATGTETYGVFNGRVYFVVGR